MKSMKNESVDLIVSDPPYLINYCTNYRKDKNHDFCTSIQNDNNPELIKNYLKECKRIMKNNTAIYIFCNSEKIEFFKTEMEKLFKIKNIIVWVKNNWTAGDLKAAFGKQYEFIILANKGRKEFNGKRVTDVWEFDRVHWSKLTHQNEKPVKLLERCVKKHSNEGETVFDGFAGSFSLSEACDNLKRNWICIEKEEKYCKIGLERINKNRVNLNSRLTNDFNLPLLK